MPALVVFRADASITIGSGHVMRCLTLAEVLRDLGAECMFITRTLPGHYAAEIKGRGFVTKMLPSPRAPLRGRFRGHEEWAGVSWKQDVADTRAAFTFADWLVVDHYAFDARWERCIADKVDKVMAVDDLADRPHSVHLLLDQNLGRSSTHYQKLVADDCRLLLGPRFALLRPEFSAARATALPARESRNPKHILVSMGGVDTGCATLRVLSALSKCDLSGDVQVTVVMGGKAPSLGEVFAFAKNMTCSVKVLVDVPNMAELMANSDVAIGAGGGTTWERCCLGLPSVLIKTAENQAFSISQMRLQDAAICPKSLEDSEFEDSLSLAVCRVIQEHSRFSAKCAEICDGLGANRVAGALICCSLSVRDASLEDAELIWHWRYHGAEYEHYLNSKPVSLGDHIKWFNAALTSNNKRLLVLQWSGIPFAHVRLDINDEMEKEAEVSIYLSQKFCGMGLGSKALLASFDSAFARDLETINARVHKDNRASLRTFQNAGFSLESEAGTFVRLSYHKQCPLNQ